MAKTIAFIGLSGALGYDYRNPAPRVGRFGSSSPNPVLENVLGLLICYDELVFLTPQFCPADMRHLPYVRFVSDDDASLRVVSSALATFDQTTHQPWEQHPSFDRFGEILAEMCGPGREPAGIDNHTHHIELGTAMVTGNGMALDQAMRDLWIIAELGLDRADVIFNSPAQEALNAQLEAEIVKGSYFGPEKRAAATNLVALEVPNFLGSRGSYHDALEVIRDRPDVAEFRKFLLEIDAPDADGSKLASEISRAAFDTIDDLSHRYLKNKHWFRSLGIPAVRGVLNSVTPALGSAVALGIEAPFMLGESRFKNASRWAPFVVNLGRPKL